MPFLHRHFHSLGKLHSPGSGSNAASGFGAQGSGLQCLAVPACSQISIPKSLFSLAFVFLSSCHHHLAYYFQLDVAFQIISRSPNMGRSKKIRRSAKFQGKDRHAKARSHAKGDGHHRTILLTVFILEALIVDTYRYLVLLVPGFLCLYARRRTLHLLPPGTVPWDLNLFAAAHCFLVEAHILRTQRALLVGTGPFQSSSINAELFSRFLHDGIAFLAWMFSGFNFNPLTVALDLHPCFVNLFCQKEPLNVPSANSTTGFSPYRYTPLSGPRLIRVIVLEKLSGHKPHQDVRCRMEEIHLDAGEPFTALSYAWDSHKGAADIICDGRIIKVSKNCVAALRRFQNTSAVERLWVDAICINQSDTAEKKIQLGIMGEIYVKAHQVRAWLGEHDKASELVFNFLNDLSKPPEYKGAPAGIKVARRWPDLSKSLVEFFGRSWFTRAWPIQEVALPLPGRVKVVCGASTMDFENIRLAWETLSDCGLLPMAINLDQAVALQFYLADAIALKRNGATAQRQDHNHQALITDLSGFSFTAVMHAMRFKSCRDARDKFFALYGVFQELEINHGIPISAWDKSDAEVFEAVARACIKLDGLAMLSRAQTSAGPYYELDADQSIRRLTRQNPYDSFLAAMSTMACRTATAVKNRREGRDFDKVAAKWQTKLPSWIPDWTQLPSANLDAANDIKLSTSRRRQHPTTPDESPGLDVVLLNVFGDWKFGIKFNPSFASESEPDMAPSHLDPSVAPVQSHDCMPTRNKASLLEMEVRFIGETTAIGSVDSILLIFQSLSAISFPSLSANSPKDFLQGFLHPAPDPAFSALVELACNFIWKSHMAQVLVSLRMFLRTMHLDHTSLLLYSVVGFGVVFLRRRIHEGVCMRYHHIAACPTDGYRMRQLAGRERLVEFDEMLEWNRFTAAWIASPWFSHRNMLNWDIWYEMTSQTLILVALVLWDLRESVGPMTFGPYLYEKHWWLVGPLYVRFLAALVQQGASMLGDNATFLLAQAVTSLTSIALAAGFLTHWALTPFLAAVALRAARRPIEFLMQVFGLDTRYRPAGMYTPGMHFFATDTGITGSTSAPVKTGDCLVLVDGSEDFLILRGGRKGYRVVGSAYVGNRTRQEMQCSSEFWVRARIE